MLTSIDVKFIFDCACLYRVVYVYQQVEKIKGFSVLQIFFKKQMSSVELCCSPIYSSWNKWNVLPPFNMKDVWHLTMHNDCFCFYCQGKNIYIFIYVTPHRFYVDFQWQITYRCRKPWAGQGFQITTCTCTCVGPAVWFWFGFLLCGMYLRWKVNPGYRCMLTLILYLPTLTIYELGPGSRADWESTKVKK